MDPVYHRLYTSTDAFVLLPARLNGQICVIAIIIIIIIIIWPISLLLLLSNLSINQSVDQSLTSYLK